MNLSPLNGNVIVERQPAATQTASGIVLRSSEEPDKAKVVATSTDAVKVGENLLINWNKSYKIKDETYRIHIDDVIAVFED